MVCLQKLRVALNSSHVKRISHSHGYWSRLLLNTLVSVNQNTLKGNVAMKRSHELFLINLGLEALLEKATAKPVVKKVEKKSKKKKWTKAQHKKYAETMAKKWGKKQSQ
jgi:hypothetical protein